MKFRLDTVDEVKVTILMDNTAGANGLMGTWGLCQLVTIKNRTGTRNVLLDVGPNPEALATNMQMLGVNAGSIDAVVMSHLHWDHSKGLAQVVKELGPRPFGLPVVAHPDTFRKTFATRPSLRVSGMQLGDSAAEIEAAGAQLILSRDPIEITPGVYSAGEVARTVDFESSTESTGLVTWTLDEEGHVAEDKVVDDQCIIVNLAGKGLVVVTGCSHAGIINMCKHVKEVTGVDRLEAVIGGFHLTGATEERISKTVAAMKELNPSKLASGHCTGFEAEVAFANAFGRAYKHFHTGARYEFSSKV
jgi:7,8-dihydropterin-6-yl-methyl-4-(beta-D-ribofuranosyl)aminobenzene 5'-phosphate synthase